MCLCYWVDFSARIHSAKSFMCSLLDILTVMPLIKSHTQLRRTPTAVFTLTVLCCHRSCRLCRGPTINFDNNLEIVHFPGEANRREWFRISQCKVRSTMQWYRVRLDRYGIFGRARPINWLADHISRYWAIADILVSAYGSQICANIKNVLKAGKNA